jgi:cation:H+ antiporter
MSRRHLIFCALKYLAGATVIFWAAPGLAENSEALADLTGLANSFFGILFIAAMTSLPESVAAIAAFRIGALDLAIGNIFGSNRFNLFALAILDVASPVPLVTVAAPVHLLTAVASIVTTAVAILSLLYRAERRFWLIEPDAVVLILLVFGALYLVYART